MSTERAVETLLASDPDFGLLCDVLYGPDSDATEVWNDVFGFAKAETAAPAKAVARIQSARKLIEGGLGKTPAPVMLKPRKVAKLSIKPAAKVAGRITAKPIKAAGRITAKPIKAAAMKIPTVPELAGGIARGWKGAEKAAAAIGPQGASPEQVARRASAVNQGRTVGNAIRHPLKTAAANPGKTAVGALATGAVAEHRRNSKINYADVPQNAVYGKSDTPEFEASGEFTKFDDDKRLAFGWASVVKKDGVEVVDRQGDWIDPDDLENAAYKYVLSSRIGGDMHKRNGDSPHHVSDLVESFVVTPEKIAKMGLPESTPIGWWVGFKVHDDETWDLVKKKGRTGFSIHGRGKRAMHELDF